MVGVALPTRRITRQSNMNVHRTTSPSEASMMDTNQLRETYLIEDLLAPGELRYRVTDLDRAIVGFACPGKNSLELQADASMRADTFCERRELGVLNLAGSGTVTVDGTDYALGNRECLYIGRGAESVIFSAEEGQKPEFYLVSYPAHHSYPTTKATQADANRVDLGSGSTANERTIFQYIHEGGIKSCQLVMGYTELKEGSVWNTMPAHTHDRRSEVYLYFDVPEGNMVTHLMGEPQETRHVLVHDRQAVLSPPWSIHSGCGTSNYCFVWAMGGENQRFDDMDGVAVTDLR